MDKLEPLRAVMSRKFIAYGGTHVLLSCGHTLVRSRDTHHRQMRCAECARTPAKHEVK